jgi:flavin reductase (DIM6/NTAB) family NADH-FMN oxidoreductase RutF
MKTIDPTELPVRKVHGYLLGAVGPRPIAFASTMDEDGHPNLAPFSFFNVFSANPPIMIFSPARRGTDNTTKDTLHNAKATKEVVINVVDYSMVEQMSLASTDYPSDVNEFVKSGLTPLKSEVVRPFRVAESPVQFECKVRDIVEFSDQPGSGNLIICEVLRIHIKDSVLDNDGRIDQKKIDLVARMGGNWYCRANADSMFEVEKPIGRLGIGVDGLPESVRNSAVLTGNDLGKLGNSEGLPDETSVNEFKLTELADLFLKFQDDQASLERELHRIAHEELQKNEAERAWKTLLAFNDR